MFQRIKIVTAVQGEKASAPYVGFDALAADKVYAAECAKHENDDVRLFGFPQYTKIRFPAREHETAKGAEIAAKAVSDQAEADAAKAVEAEKAAKTATKKAEKAAKTAVKE
jgi:hypothetical protein